jgi:hypothetical protein
MWYYQILLKSSAQPTQPEVNLTAWHTLIYIKFSTLVALNSGNWALHFPKKAAISSPFLTSTTLRCPLPSQKLYVISIISFLILSCSCNHCLRSNSRSIRSCSSLSRSGRKDVSTFGFLVNRFFGPDSASLSRQAEVGVVKGSLTCTGWSWPFEALRRTFLIIILFKGQFRFLLLLRLFRLYPRCTRPTKVS